ncbi:hypothetical protein JTA33_00465 [Pseudomonas sp. 20GA0080]|uniref:hypothetical protein n=1 Tax=Pseudomonas alliivorans TaxID=2810613 RepID=UPI001AE34723|nr:hypothetical protein [Pseudomonas alliivorans]MBP0948920.1 hypothetical protein [Pseudomonas alliivorans]
MSNDKMQDYVLDEFLKWMADECDARGESYTLCTERDGFGRFLYVWVQTSWLAWQASREALVIELPDDDYLNRESVFVQGYIEGVRLTKEAIEAAGVKVKP